MFQSESSTILVCFSTDASRTKPLDTWQTTACQFPASRFVSLCALPAAINLSCCATGSAPTAIGRSLLLAWSETRCRTTHETLNLVRTLSDSIWRPYFNCTSAFSVLQVVTRMRYVNPHLSLSLTMQTCTSTLLIIMCHLVVLQYVVLVGVIFFVLVAGAVIIFLFKDWVCNITDACTRPTCSLLWSC